MNILPECYADTTMIEILGFPRVNHCPNIGEVANRMKKNYTNKLAIGIVDKDKPGTVPSYFNDFELIKEYDGIEVKKLPNTKHYLIVIAPALEQWIINTSNDLGVPLESYGFKSLKQLMRITKSQTVGKHQKYKDLINTLKQKKNSPLKKLLSDLNDILESKYN